MATSSQHTRYCIDCSICRIYARSSWTEIHCFAGVHPPYCGDALFGTAHEIGRAIGGMALAGVGAGIGELTALAG
jgi:hypothetical protein